MNHLTIAIGFVLYYGFLAAVVWFGFVIPSRRLVARRVLMACGGHPDTTVHDLADDLQVHQDLIHETIARLVQKNLVQRDPEDRCWVLLPLGELALREIRSRGKPNALAPSEQIPSLRA